VLPWGEKYFIAESGIGSQQLASPANATVEGRQLDSDASSRRVPVSIWLVYVAPRSRVGDLMNDSARRV
jgi:hypothetical protein